MKRMLLVFAISLCSLVCFGQAQPKTGSAGAPSAQIFMNYIIKVNTFAEGQYGYDILYQGKPVVSQKINPFTLSPKGLPNKEDVFKTARWQIQQLAAGASPEIFSGRPLPLALARQLNIALN